MGTPWSPILSHQSRRSLPGASPENSWSETNKGPGEIGRWKASLCGFFPEPCPQSLSLETAKGANPTNHANCRINNFRVLNIVRQCESLSLRHNADITGLTEMGAQPTLWFFGYGFSILPNIDRRAVHSRNSPRSAGSGGHGPLHGFEETFVFRRYFPLFHGPVSINRGVFPELSYNIQASAMGL